jgi:hypothetical protein
MRHRAISSPSVLASARGSSPSQHRASRKLGGCGCELADHSMGRHCRNHIPTATIAFAPPHPALLWRPSLPNGPSVVWCRGHGVLSRPSEQCMPSITSVESMLRKFCGVESFGLLRPCYERDRCVWPPPPEHFTASAALLDTFFLAYASPSFHLHDFVWRTFSLLLHRAYSPTAAHTAAHTAFSPRFLSTRHPQQTSSTLPVSLLGVTQSRILIVAPPPRQPSHPLQHLPTHPPTCPRIRDQHHCTHRCTHRCTHGCTTH